jgi:hypothetical protein
MHGDLLVLLNRSLLLLHTDAHLVLAEADAWASIRDPATGLSNECFVRAFVESELRTRSVSAVCVLPSIAPIHPVLISQLGGLIEPGLSGSEVLATLEGGLVIASSQRRSHEIVSALGRNQSYSICVNDNLVNVPVVVTPIDLDPLEYEWGLIRRVFHH